MTPLLRTLLAIVLAVLVWSGIGPYDRFTWFLEVLPVLIAVPILFATYRRFPLTNLAYVLIAIHAVILMVGGHYTYAEVPLFNWIRDTYGLARNEYDHLGHFAQGFIPAIIAREVLLRHAVVRRGAWLVFVILCICLAISSVYELIEWLTAVAAGAAAEDFLGTQGDAFDTQKDMAYALLGATVALLTLSRLHDRQLHTKNAGG